MKFSPTALLAAALLGCAPGAFAQNLDQSFYSMLEEVGITKIHAYNAIVVTFKDGYSDSQKAQRVQSYGLGFDSNVTSPYFARLIVPDQMLAKTSLHHIIERLNLDPMVKYAETDPIIFKDQAAPNDPGFVQQYAMHNTGQSGGLIDADIDALEGWNSIRTDVPPVIIAVIDEGFDVNHPDLVNMYHVNPGEIAGNGIDDDNNGFVDDTIGWDFNANDNNVAANSTSNDHGMHCAGIVAMEHNNGVGGAGAAKRSRVMPIKLSNGGTTYMSSLTSSVDYAWQNGAKVMTVSYNIDSYTQALSDAIGRAAQADVVYCNSAGNNSANNSARSALRNIHNNTVFIASTTRTDTLSSFSNFGTRVDLAAPGSDIYSCVLNNNYGLKSGTSMAAPCAAAVIGTVRMNFPELTARQAIDRVIATSDFTTPLAGVIAGGRVNLARALDSDSTPPSNPNALRICKRNSSAALFEFEGSGDDGTAGQATFYEIRYSASPITPANFNAATVGAVITTSVNHGALVSGTVNGLMSGQNLYFAVRSFDNLANPSAGLSTMGPVQLPAPIFADDVEGAAKWSSTTWGIVTGNAASGTKSWTDSPAGFYPNNYNAILTMNTPITLNQNSMFQFKANVATEANWDFAFLEISTDNGGSWFPIWRFAGPNGGWKSYSIGLGQYVGQTINLRWRMTSDSSQQQEGIFLDDFAIVAARDIFFDNVEGASPFSGTPWGIASGDAVSGTRAWSDSPVGNYAANANALLSSTISFDTSGLTNPVLTFASKLNIDRFDSLQGQTSTNNGGTWTTVETYTGRENRWGLISMNLPQAPAVNLGLRLISNGTTQADGILVDDIRISGTAWLNTIAGSAILGGYVGPNAKPITLELLTPNSNTVVATYVLSGTPSGNVLSFSRDVAQSGQFELRLGGSGFLKKKAGVFDLSICDPVINVSLISGDADGNNEVGPADFAILSNAFGTELGDAGYVANADFNGDGEIGPADFSILSANFGQEGE